MKTSKLVKESKKKNEIAKKKSEKPATAETVSLSIEDLSEVNGGLAARQQGLCSYDF